MKRTTFLLMGILAYSQILLGGGLVTNTNQSAAWVRTLSRNATLGVDAVYFNPAGLSQLKNGFHISLSNQTIFQTRTLSCDYPYLGASPASYEADLMAPVFPSGYLAFKLNKLTISGGVNMIGGGGSADFQSGLPSFEIPVASIVPLLQSSLSPLDEAILGAMGNDPGFRNVTGYNLNAAFNGRSLFMGYQLGASYAINDMISVYLGGRVVSVSNSYEGSLTGITVDAPAVYGGTQKPGTYVRTVAMTPGLDPVTVGTLNATADYLDLSTADAQLEASQKGTGITPIIGINLHLTDMLNIAARYEHHTRIELTNETEVDDVGMFPDGQKVRSDMPGMFALGAQLSPLKKLTASLSLDYYLDRPAFYGNMDLGGEQINNESTIDQNAYTIAASLEYKFLGILGVSAGYSTGNLGVNDNYQSDLGYALKSQTVGGGLFVHLGQMVVVNAGVAVTMYDDYVHAQSYQPSGFPEPVPFNTTYGKSNMIIALGLDISL